jgi:hypothetical protein
LVSHGGRVTHVTVFVTVDVFVTGTVLVCVCVNFFVTVVVNVRVTSFVAVDVVVALKRRCFLKRAATARTSPDDALFVDVSHGGACCRSACASSPPAVSP